MAPAASDRDAARGKELYAPLHGLHGVDGRGEAKTFRPNVGNLAVKAYLDQVSDEYLFAAIKLGGVAVGKNAAMPAWDKQLDDGQIWMSWRSCARWATAEPRVTARSRRIAHAS